MQKSPRFPTYSSCNSLVLDWSNMESRNNDEPYDSLFKHCFNFFRRQPTILQEVFKCHNSLGKGFAGLLVLLAQKLLTTTFCFEGRNTLLVHLTLCWNAYCCVYFSIVRLLVERLSLFGHWASKIIKLHVKCVWNSSQRAIRGTTDTNITISWKEKHHRSKFSENHNFIERSSSTHIVDSDK